MEIRSSPESPSRRHLSASVFACVLFVPVGLITVMLGPLLPLLSSRWSLNDTQAGYLVTAQFIGSLLGTVLSSPTILKLQFRWTMIVGVGFMTLGVATFLSGTYFLSLAAVFCYGAGIGITVPAANLLVARAAGTERGASLSLLNFFWSAGAVICPLLLAAFLARNQITLFLFVVAAFLGILILALVTVPFRPIEPGVRVAPHGGFYFLRTALTLAFAAMFFLYVGSESALGSWLSTYAKRVGDAHGGEWITVSAYFYGALLVGRLAASGILRRLSDISLARSASLLAVSSVAALLLSQKLSAIIISSVVVGLGLSALYPIAIGLASIGFGDAAERIMGTLFAFSTIGGACVPWLVGYVSTRSGSLRTALLVPLAGCALMAVLFWSPTISDWHSATSQET